MWKKKRKKKEEWKLYSHIYSLSNSIRNKFFKQNINWSNTKNIRLIFAYYQLIKPFNIRQIIIHFLHKNIIYTHLSSFFPIT